MLKKVLSLLMTFVLLFSVPFSVSAQNQKKFESAQESLSEEERFLNSLSEPALDIDIENLCNYYNGLEYTVDETIDDVLHCQVVGDSYVQIYYENALKQRASVPEYLERAYNSIFGENQNLSRSGRSSSSNYIISDRGLFKIFYDDVNTSSGTFNMSAVRLMGAIFDAIAGYFSDFEFPTTDGTYYEVYLSSSLDALGKTWPSGRSRSYIEINYGLLYEFYADDEKTFVLGTAAHEFVHALGFHYDITYDTLAAQCFHEGFARAVGIMYDDGYANNWSVCNDISNFVENLGNSFMTVNSPEYRYGTSLFALFLVQEFDTVDHDTLDIIRYLFEELRELNSLDDDDITTTFSNVISAYSNVLPEHFNTTLSGKFKIFMIYNATPDNAYSYAPKNRLGAEAESWGTPVYQSLNTVSATGQTYYASANLSYLSAHYHKFTLSGTAMRQLTLEMTYSAATPYSNCVLGYVNHQTSSDSYSYKSILWGQEFVWTKSFLLKPNGVTELYLVIVNTGEEAYVTYTLSGRSQ